MPFSHYSGNERQSVYEKALVMCHEGEKKLSLLQQELERSKLQSYISYKREERELRNELFQIKREQRSLVKEAKQRRRDNKSIDDIAKEMKIKNPGNRGATAIMLEKKFALPQINCTQKNVPKILQRTLSHESEFFTWTFGLRKIENVVKALNPEGEQKKKGNIPVSTEESDDSEAINGEGLERARANTIHSVVYNVPVSEPKAGKSVTQNLPSINRISKTSLTGSLQNSANVNKEARNRGVLNNLSSNKLQRIELPKL